MHPEQVVQHHIQVDFESLQWSRLHSLSGQPDPGSVMKLLAESYLVSQPGPLWSISITITHTHDDAIIKHSISNRLWPACSPECHITPQRLSLRYMALTYVHSGLFFQTLREEALPGEIKEPLWFYPCFLILEYGSSTGGPLIVMTWCLNYEPKTVWKAIDLRHGIMDFTVASTGLYFKKWFFLFTWKLIKPFLG